MIRNANNAPFTQRQLRVGELIKQSLGQIFLKDEAKVPSLETKNITVTEVRMSNDLKSATVFVVPMGRSDENRIIQGLNRASFFVRKKITEFITLKFLPKINFKIDSSFDKFRQIDDILKRPEVVKDLQINSNKN